MMNDKFLRRRKFISGVLALCILIGIACRFTGVNWDSNAAGKSAHLHPDERFLTMIADDLQWPHSPAEYLDTARAPLNPFNHHTAFFVYGQLPLVLAKGVATVFHRDNYDGLFLVGRVLSAFFDCLTLLFVFLIGQKIGESRLQGLFAAALLSLTALNIQHAHFFVTDIFAAMFLTAAFFFALCAFDPFKTQNLKLKIACGVSYGAACACKFSSVLFGIVLFAFFLVQWKKGKASLAPTVLGTAFFAFRVLHPIAFRGEGGVLTLWGLLDLRLHPQFWNALSQQAKISSGQIEMPFNWQWLGRANWIWPIENLGSWALGWPLLICGFAGIALIALRVLRKREAPPGICGAALWTVFCLAFYGAQFSKFTRYYLAATPFICLLAAWFLFQIEPRALRRICAAGVLGYSLIWSLAVTSIYTRPNPRVAATRWILENIPSGTMITNETVWDDVLPLQNVANYRALDLKLFEADDENKRAHLLQVLDEADWIFISSPRVWKTLPRLPQRFPLTTEYYRALFDGSLGFERAQEFHSYPRIFGWEFPDGNVEEALTVYDHPRVILLRKTDKYSEGNAARILSQIRLAPTALSGESQSR